MATVDDRAFTADPLQELCDTDPWHAGEIALQESVGQRDAMRESGQKYIRGFLTEQHRDFYPLLPYVILGSVDESGDAWATIRTGPPGFLSCPDDQTLFVSGPRDRRDPAEYGLNSGGAVGVLGIQLETRRRNRVNGMISDRGATGMTIKVEHSYGNCPRYIRLRDSEFVTGTKTRWPIVRRPSKREVKAMVEGADCFYVASYIQTKDKHRQVDVSHRGGKAGFVRYDEQGVLTVPDFNGNSYFNTLGNFMLNPRAGLMFIDFDRGSLLQMTGRAEVLLDSSETAHFQGAERLWRFEPTREILRVDAVPVRLRARQDGESDFSLATGAWTQG